MFIVFDYYFVKLGGVLNTNQVLFFAKTIRFVWL